VYECGNFFFLGRNSVAPTQLACDPVPRSLDDLGKVPFKNDRRKNKENAKKWEELQRKKKGVMHGKRYLVRSESKYVLKYL